MLSSIAIIIVCKHTWYLDHPDDYFNVLITLGWVRRAWQGERDESAAAWNVLLLFPQFWGEFRFSPQFWGISIFSLILGESQFCRELKVSPPFSEEISRLVPVSLICNATNLKAWIPGHVLVQASGLYLGQEPKSSTQSIKEVHWKPEISIFVFVQYLFNIFAMFLQTLSYTVCSYLSCCAGS